MSYKFTPRKKVKQMKEYHSEQQEALQKAYEALHKYVIDELYKMAQS